MRFIKKWNRGAKSCRITYNHPDSRTKYTLYPMIHMASASFYKKISDDLNRFDFILYEGVTWRKNNKKHPMYDWAAKSLGLVTQKDHLKMPKDIRSINIDMPSDEFREEFIKKPLFWKLPFILIRPLFWLIVKITGSKRKVLSYIVPDNIYTDNSLEETPIGELIVTERDKCIVNNLINFNDEHKTADETIYIAVIFGAKHMIAINRCLRGLGFTPKTKKWFELICPQEYEM